MKNEHVDAKLLLNVATGAAMQAGRILKKGFGTSFFFATKTGVHDLITEHDKSSENAILAFISKTFPGHSFLSEESGLAEHGSGSIRWIIDPIDGTLNFCHSIPYFAVSIAAELSGEILCGVVYNPITEEMFSASKGGGAWLNDKKLQVSKTQELKNSVLAIGFPFNTEADPGHCLSRFVKVAGKGAQLLRMGSTAMNLAYVAAGRFDGFWETDFFPWDVAAGSLIVEEAGGKVSNINGLALKTHKAGIIATNKQLHKEIVEALHDSADNR